MGSYVGVYLKKNCSFKENREVAQSYIHMIYDTFPYLIMVPSSGVSFCGPL